MCKVKLSYFFLGCDYKKKTITFKEEKLLHIFFLYFPDNLFIYQSIPSLTTPRATFERANSPPPGHKEGAKPLSLGQKNRARTQPWGQLFSKFQQKNTKHETEIMKNGTEMLICLEILKQ